MLAARHGRYPFYGQDGVVVAGHPRKSSVRLLARDESLLGSVRSAREPFHPKELPTRTHTYEYEPLP